MIRIKIGMVRYADCVIDGHVVGRKYHSGNSHWHRLARIVLHAVSVSPIGKDLSHGRGKGAFSRLSFAVRVVHIGIYNRLAGSIASFVGHCVDVAHKDRTNTGILIQRFIDVDKVTLAIHPLQQRLTMLRNEGHSLIILAAFSNGGSLRHRETYIIVVCSRNNHFNTHIDLRLPPIGIEHQIVGRHRRTAEVEGLCFIRDLTRFYRIPAYKFSVCAKRCRSSRCDILV